MSEIESVLAYYSEVVDGLGHRETDPEAVEELVDLVKETAPLRGAANQLML